MSTPARSQDVCVGCRSRKKRCNGIRPSCASCLKRGEVCLYSAPTSSRSQPTGQETWLPAPEVPLQTWGLTTLLTQAPTWIDPSQWTQFNADAGLDLAFLSEPPEIRDLPTPQKSSSSPSDARTPPAMDSLPDTPLFLDLIDIFFERLYSYVPVLHKKKLVESVTCNGIDAVPSSLVFAIAAVTASHHPDQSVQARQDGWFLDAKRDMTKHMHAQDHAVQSLQAAVLIIYQAVVKTDFSTTWILLGEAWRKAVAIGCSQVDGGKIRVMPALGFDFRSNWIETEEARRVTWVLYMFDRGVCFSVGLVHAIDDRRLRINLPMPEDAFQAASPDSFEPTLKDPIKFCSDLDAMITSAQAHCRNKSASMLQLLILAYILLSNISEVMHSVDFDHDKDESKLETCIAHLVRIQLMLPQFATDLSAARYEDFPAVVWLNFLLATCTILLHHRPLKGGETLDGPSSMASHWPHCVAASRNSVSMIRQASRSSTNLLTNAHIPTLLFSLSRILVIEYFCPSQAKYGADPNAKGVEPPANVVRDSALRENLGVLALSFTRLRDALDRVGQKFYKGFAFWVMEGPKVSPEAKRIGSLTLLHTCENWPAVPDDQDIDIPS